MLYDDGPDGWPMVLKHWDDWTCEQKVQNAVEAHHIPVSVNEEGRTREDELGGRKEESGIN